MITLLLSTASLWGFQGFISNGMTSPQVRMTEGRGASVPDIDPGRITVTASTRAASSLEYLVEATLSGSEYEAYALDIRHRLDSPIFACPETEAMTDACPSDVEVTIEFSGTANGSSYAIRASDITGVAFGSSSSDVSSTLKRPRPLPDNAATPNDLHHLDTAPDGTSQIVLRLPWP